MIALSWRDLLRLVERSPRLTAGQSRVAAARGAISAAGAVPNPTLEADLGQGQARVSDESRLEWSLSLNVPLGWIAQRSSRMAAAEAALDQANAERQVLRRELLLQLGTLYWNLAHDRARLRALEALHGQTAQLTRAVRIRVEKGEARPIELIRVEVELEKVIGELEAARSSLEARQGQLALWLRPPEGMTVLASTELSTDPVPPGKPAAPGGIGRRQPILTAARARVRELEAALRAEELARVPPVGLRGFTAHELDRHAFGVGLSLEVPLWNWNRGRIAKAKAELAAARSELEATALELESSTIQAESDCRAGSRLAVRLERGVLPRSEKAAATVERMYLLGEATLPELIDARRTSLEARQAHLGALARAKIDCHRWRVVVGQGLP